MKKELMIILVLTLSSCHKIAGNYPNIYYLDFVKHNDEYLIDDYSISLNDMKYRKQNEFERNYYNDNIIYNENYLFDDLAYDSFIQHQSYTKILTNNEYTFILMCKTRLYSEKYYLYLFDYKNGKLNELSLY